MTTPDGGETFATKLQRLLQAVRRDDGSPYTPREVAEEVTSRGHNLSKGYAYDLLKGKSEPSHALVQALASFFAVPLEYFADTERGQELGAQYEILAELGEGNVRELAQRARGLSPEALRSVLDFIDFQSSRGQQDESA